MAGSLAAAVLLAPQLSPAQNPLAPEYAGSGRGAFRVAGGGGACAPRPVARGRSGRGGEQNRKRSDLAGARPLLEKHPALHPQEARALVDLGYLEDATNHEEAAAADYRKAIAADPKQFESRLALGLLLAHQGKWDEARVELEQATQVQPSPPNPAGQAQAFRTLAELDRTRDPQAARDALLSALKLSPETPSDDMLLTAQIAGSQRRHGDRGDSLRKRVLARPPDPAGKQYGVRRQPPDWFTSCSRSGSTGTPSRC